MHDLQPTHVAPSRATVQRTLRVDLPRGFVSPACLSEVAWDPSQAKHPGERFNLTAAEVRQKIASGILERGCMKCGANAGIPPGDL